MNPEINMFSNMIQISADENPEKFQLENLKLKHHWEYVDIEGENNIKMYLKIVSVRVWSGYTWLSGIVN
jgi:hypothetical protein